MNFNKTAVEIADKMNKPIRFALGNPVIHKATGLCGTVEAVESFGTTDGQMLTVALLNGRKMRGIRREEFALHHPGAEQIRAQGKKLVEATEAAQKAAIKIIGIEGPISTESILDELC